MEQLLKTVFYEKHVSLGAKMVEFGGWEMPVQYETGIVQEHLNTRKQAGLFDVSHMGRFIVGGPAALDFLQHVLTNNAAALEIEESQYTMIQDDSGGAIDDAYLYRFRRKSTCWWSMPRIVKKTGSTWRVSKKNSAGSASKIVPASCVC